ncbi:hypothetical protein ACFSMW_11200 [Virgibacillus halophilus]|uniref:Uncharacterized protein n=1 Tax=Tigheibacillus halophilus TaxID=361280 RepID=A0ABU5C7A0_9BACI|nr:hypothetical protein [Virgibacillus halophilus]
MTKIILETSIANEVPILSVFKRKYIIVRNHERLGAGGWTDNLQIYTGSV